MLISGKHAGAEAALAEGEVLALLLAGALVAVLVLPPAPTARVNDYAGLLQPAERQRLESRIAERERATGVQVAIAIFPSLEGESVEDVSIRLAEKWRIGQKELNNGVILVVFVTERKLRLEVGYGLEPVIPDAIAGGIVRDVITPRFREGKYAAGLEAAVDAMYARAQGATSGPPARRRAPDRQTLPILGFLVLLGVVAAILGMEVFRSRRSVERQSFTGDRHGWSGPIISPWGGGGGAAGGGDTFSGGGGEFGGGGASGEW